jgi:hypothetical protein
MPAGRSPTSLWDEIARLLTSGLPPTDILTYRLPRSVERRARELLAKSNAGALSCDEERELVQFEQAELLMRLVKARLRGLR